VHYVIIIFETYLFKNILMLQEVKRRQQIEAAERRMQEQDTRGIKDPERFKREKRKREEFDRRQEEADKKYTGERGGQLTVIFLTSCSMGDCLCGLVIRVPGFRSRGPGSIPGATRFSGK
jgi:small VCP/p97-interacting protein